jgi:hypothetical protein
MEPSANRRTSPGTQSQICEAIRNKYKTTHGTEDLGNENGASDCRKEFNFRFVVTKEQTLVRAIAQRSDEIKEIR